MVDATRRWAKASVFPRARLTQICDWPSSLWLNGSNTRSGGHNNCVDASRAAALRSSLALVRPEGLSIEVILKNWDDQPRKTCWSKFTYNGEDYVLKQTHPDVIKAYLPKAEGTYPLEDVYICVSLTEPFSGDGNCHKLVAAVFSEQESR